MAFVWRAYMHQLRVNTLRTQMATSAVVMGLGNVITQQVVRRQGFDRHDWISTLRFAGYGCFVFTPMANRWHFLMNKIQLSSVFRTTVTRLAIDMAIFSPAITTMFFFGMGLLEGRSLHEIKDRWYKNFSRVIVRQWAVFGPAQALNMSVIPLYARPPFLNLVGLAWSTYLATVSAEMNDQPAGDRMTKTDIDRIAAVVME